MNLEEFLEEWHHDSPRLLVHTSGSTGKPKPLWVEKERMLASARITCDFLGLQPGDTALLCMSLDYIAGKMMVVRAIERQLRLVAVEPSGHPLATLLGRQEGTEKTDVNLMGAPTFAAMVPMQVYNSLQVAEERELLRQIRHLIIGGGAIDDDMARELHDFPNAVWSTYGMTETLSHIALRRLNGPEASEWYTTLPGVGICTDEEGCLVVDAPKVCPTRLRTNDIAEIRTADHAPTTGTPQQFRIIGRRDNVVCSGGIKIQAEEVERLLAPHIHKPFAITKRKDTKLGEAVVLLTEANDLDDIKTLCAKLLPRYWQPRHFQHTDHLPTTATGKLARKAIEQMVDNAIS